MDRWRLLAATITTVWCILGAFACTELVIESAEASAPPPPSCDPPDCSHCRAEHATCVSTAPSCDAATECGFFAVECWEACHGAR